jgi:FMN phosphatase YigB (HAD superfamily)
VTCSDCDTSNVLRDLSELEILGYFSDFFHMTPNVPKDFSGVRDVFSCSFEDILVVGDNYDIDISSAKDHGCKTIHTPLERNLSLEEISCFV